MQPNDTPPLISVSANTPPDSFQLYTLDRTVRTPFVENAQQPTFD